MAKSCECLGESERFGQLLNEWADQHLSDLKAQDLASVLCRFRSEIASKRAANHLKDGRSLLTCLAARHILRPDDLSALDLVAQLLNRPAILPAADAFCCTDMACTHQRTNDHERFTSYATLTDLVVGEVSDRIGHDWRNLARELGACAETEIRRIEQSCSDHQSAARQALELFRTRNRHEDHVRRIATALKAIRRHNLAARVRELSRNHGHDIRF